MKILKNRELCKNCSRMNVFNLRQCGKSTMVMQVMIDWMRKEEVCVDCEYKLEHIILRQKEMIKENGDNKNKSMQTM